MSVNDSPIQVKAPVLGTSPRITIANDSPNPWQRFYALITVLAPIIGAVAAIVVGFYVNVSPIEIILLIVMWALNGIGIELGFHRYFSHSAFQTNSLIKASLAILGSTAGQGPPIYWAANHRRHHQYSDTMGDSHSPNLHGTGGLKKLHGLWHAHMGWIIDLELTNTFLFAKDLLRDPLVCRINQFYFLWLVLGLIIPAAIDGIVSRSWMGVLLGFLWGGLLRIFIAQQVTYAVNSICHVYGHRPFQSNDLSTNNFWLAIPTFGGAWHNNHHTFPNSAITGFHWWQIDLSGLTVTILEKMGLVWNVKRPNPKMLVSKLLTS
jgi:stearoyl-CoA desaturase (delta-9 desaturase)